MKKIYLFMAATLFAMFGFGQDLIITGVFDATLTGGSPKGLELYALDDIPDLSLYAVGSANNGGGSDGEEFTLSGSASAGDFIYVAYEAADGDFNSWFGLTALDGGSAVNINGDDAMELFFDTVGDGSGWTVIDTFGEIDVDGSGKAWEYLDSWAYRVSSTGPDGSTYNASNWTFGGPNAWDGETSNGGATSPMPVGTYTAGGVAPTQVFFSVAEGSVAEDGGTFDLVVSILNESSSAATQVNVELTSGDGNDLDQYTPQTVTFAAGSASDETVTITITDNSVAEGDQYFEFSLTGQTGGESVILGSPSTFTLTVTEDDATVCGNPEFFTSNVTLNSQGDTWYETSPGDYNVNGYTGGTGDLSEVWLIYGPVDMSATSIAILQFDLDEGFDGGTGSDIEVLYTGSYTGNPGDAGNSWTSAGTYLGAGDDDATGAVADISAASGSETFIGIKYTAEGSGGGSSSVVLSNIALLADVCPASGVITWTGATDSDWSNLANWDGGVPTSSDYVVVPITDNDPTISGDASVLELKVLENEAVTVTSGAALAIMGSFSGEGELTVERNTTGSGGYSAIGSPLGTAELDDIAADYLYSFDEATNMFVEETTGDMTPGVGYFAGYDASSPVISLTGVPNTGEVTTDITMADAGYNLVANPYAAPISMAEFRIGNDDIDDVIYLWDDGGSNNGGLRGGDYVTVSDVGVVSTMDLSDGVAGGQGETAAITGNIASFQGFFVKSLTGGGTVSFAPTMQTTASGANADANYYREAGEKQLVRLAISGNDLYNEILVGLTDNATLSFDNGLDAHKLSGNELISFYSFLESEKLAIQALPKVSTEEMKVQLGFDLAEAGDYTLKLAGLEGISDDISVLVYDGVTGQTYDLRESATIAFTNSASIVASKRFSLVLAPAAVLGFENAKSNFNVFTNESGLNVVTKDAFANAKVRIFAMDGKVVSQFENVDFSSKAWNTPFTRHGVYIVSIESENGLLIKKFLN